MTTAYIVIADTKTGSPAKSLKFAVIQGGYQPMMVKNQSIEQTIDGRYDVTMGGIFYHFLYILRVREANTTEEENAGYGHYADLDYFYKLNNPNADPSNLLTLTDHQTIPHTGYLVGNFVPMPLTTIIEGTQALFTVQIEFIEREATVV